MCPATSVVKQNAALCFAVKLQKLTSPDVPWHWGESIITEMSFWMNYFFSDVSLFCINLWMMCFDKMIIFFVLWYDIISLSLVSFLLSSLSPSFSRLSCRGVWRGLIAAGKLLSLRDICSRPSSVFRPPAGQRPFTGLTKCSVLCCIFIVWWSVLPLKISISTNMSVCPKPQICHKYCITFSLICDMANMTVVQSLKLIFQHTSRLFLIKV